MGELSLEDKLRSAHTKRWSIVNVGRIQNVAEHSFLVQLIAVELSRAIKYSNANGGPFNTEKEYQIMRWAMWHDLPEICTGDINTAVKTYLKKVCGEDTLKAVEYSYSDEYALIDRTTFSTIKDLVKLADYMEALGFLNIEGKGPHASKVALTIYVNMHAHFKEAKANSCVYEWDNLLPIMWSLHPGKVMGVTVIKDNAQREVGYD